MQKNKEKIDYALVNDFNWRGLRSVHFIGICGIGMSALAQLMKSVSPSINIQGSDMTAGYMAQSLTRRGIKVILGHRPENLDSELDLVVYSSAINSDNCELQQASRLGIATIGRGRLLAILTQDSYNIAIAGSHGKTTSTALLGVMLHSNWEGYSGDFASGDKDRLIQPQIEEKPKENIAPPPIVKAGFKNSHWLASKPNERISCEEVSSEKPRFERGAEKNDLVQKVAIPDFWVINGGIMEDFANNVAIIEQKTKLEKYIGAKSDYLPHEAQVDDCMDRALIHAPVAQSQVVSVVETDESDGSFTLLRPNIAVITNIDREHMDFYGSLENLYQHYSNFITNTLKNSGIVLVCGDDIGVRNLLSLNIEEECLKNNLASSSLKHRINSSYKVNEGDYHEGRAALLSYGYNKNNDWQIVDWRSEGREGSIFTVAISEQAQKYLSPNIIKELKENSTKFKKNNIKFKENNKYIDFLPEEALIIADIRVKLLGKHNICNALGMLAASLCAATVIPNFRLDLKLLLAGMGKFSGVKRRMQSLGTLLGSEDNYNVTEKNIRVFDDYAHHPREIEAVLAALPWIFPGPVADVKGGGGHQSEIVAIAKNTYESGFESLTKHEDGYNRSAKESSQPQVVLVIEPHRYSRWRDLLDDFIRVLLTAGNIDFLIITEIYAAGEKDNLAITLDYIVETLLLALEENKSYQGKLTKEKIFKANNGGNLKIILQKLKLEDNSLVLCLGAGNISGWAHQLVRNGN